MRPRHKAAEYSYNQEMNKMQESSFNEAAA